MTTSSAGRVSAAGRRIRLLAIAIVLAIAAYTGGWYYAADRLQQALLPPAGANPGAPEIRCDPAEMRGYPFRIGLFCGKVMVDDVNHGLSASLGALRSAAQVYAPQHIVWELDGPAQLRSALGMSLAAEWQMLRGSTVLAVGGGLDRASVESGRLKATFTNTVDALSVDTQSDHGEIHVRRAGADLQLAAATEGAVVAPRNGAAALPPVNAAVELIVTGQGDMLDFTGDLHERLYGASGVLGKLTLDFGQGRRVELSGPFSVNMLGLISGSFDVRLFGVNAVGETLISTYPAAEKNLRGAVSILRSLAGGGDSASARINIRDGVVMLSFIPIATLPPL